MNSWKLNPETDTTKFRGQLKIVVDKIEEMGSGTVESIAKEIGTFPNSRQTAKRIVGYYVSLLKSDGKLIPA